MTFIRLDSKNRNCLIHHENIPKIHDQKNQTVKVYLQMWGQSNKMESMALCVNTTKAEIKCEGSDISQDHPLGH